MIDLKRNSKKVPVKATGCRTRASSIYKPNQKEDFKVSRGKFSDFLTCPRCFYLNRVKGLDPPGTPGWIAKASQNSSYIWTDGTIPITYLSIIK